MNYQQDANDQDANSIADSLISGMDPVRSLLLRSPLSGLPPGYVERPPNAKMLTNTPFRKVLKCTLWKNNVRKCKWELAPVASFLEMIKGKKKSPAASSSPRLYI